MKQWDRSKQTSIREPSLIYLDDGKRCARSVDQLLAKENEDRLEDGADDDDLGGEFLARGVLSLGAGWT